MNNTIDSIELKLFSRSSAAKYLGIGKTKLDKLIAEGAIGVIPIYGKVMIPYIELRQFLHDNIVKYTSLSGIVNDSDIGSIINPQNHKFQPTNYDSNSIFNQIFKEQQNGKCLY